jgi:DNA-directed RNA polymerase specialized sigma24 family protein
MPFVLHMGVKRTTVMPMHDREMVAAIVGGDPGGIAAAYDAYAMPLYAYCRTLLPEPSDAADAVQDTFLIATAKLAGLRDPDKLRSWLYAVARNECHRRLPSGKTKSALGRERKRRELAPDLFVGALPLVALVPGFREHVLTACADVTPAGLAQRAQVAARAGPFDPAGFPRPPRRPAWRRLTRHPRTVAAGAAAVVAAAGVSAVLVMGGGNPPSHLAAAGARGSASPGVVAGSRGAPAPGPGSSPGAGGSALAPSARLGGTPAPGRVTSQSSHPARAPSGTATATSRSSSGSTSPAPGSSSASSPSSAAASSSAPAAQGTLTVSPSRVVLAAVSGHGTGTFTLTAKGGPVSYTISGPSGLSVSPASGSLASGASVTITVTSATLVTLNDQLTINPGGYAVTVVLNISL